jgi:hypothetical protein
MVCVFEQYRDWVVISVAMDALKNCVEDTERFHLLVRVVVGMLYWGQGRPIEKQRPL